MLVVEGLLVVGIVPRLSVSVVDIFSSSSSSCRSSSWCRFSSRSSLSGTAWIKSVRDNKADVIVDTLIVVALSVVVTAALSKHFNNNLYYYRTTTTSYPPFSHLHHSRSITILPYANSQKGH